MYGRININRSCSVTFKVHLFETTSIVSNFKHYLTSCQSNTCIVTSYSTVYNSVKNTV